MPAFFLTIPGAFAAIGLAALVWIGRRRAKPALVHVVLSLAVVATALYVVLARPEAPDDHKWAYAIVGAVAGYWLKASM